MRIYLEANTYFIRLSCSKPWVCLKIYESLNILIRVNSKTQLRIIPACSIICTTTCSWFGNAPFRSETKFCPFLIKESTEENLFKIQEEIIDSHPKDAIVFSYQRLSNPSVLHTLIGNAPSSLCPFFRLISPSPFPFCSIPPRIPYLNKLGTFNFKDI